MRGQEGEEDERNAFMWEGVGQEPLGSYKKHDEHTIRVIGWEGKVSFPELITQD